MPSRGRHREVPVGLEKARLEIWRVDGTLFLLSLGRRARGTPDASLKVPWPIQLPHIERRTAESEREYRAVPAVNLSPKVRQSSTGASLESRKLGKN